MQSGVCGGGGGTGAPTAMNQLWGGLACKRLRTPALTDTFLYIEWCATLTIYIYIYLVCFGFGCHGYFLGWYFYWVRPILDSNIPCGD